MKTNIELIPYGEISSRLTKDRRSRTGRQARTSKSRESSRQALRQIFLTFSQDLDETFVKMFRKRALEDSRLLILSSGSTIDAMISHIVDLQIRTPQRFYVIEAKAGVGKTKMVAFVRSLLERLVSALETDDGQDRILDARIQNGILRVISPNFDRLEVPIAEIPDLRNAEPIKIQKFELDDDGAFIYWRDLVPRQH